MTNTYKNVGVVFNAPEMSLICALPFDASTHMGAYREQLANYYFDHETMDISAQGKVHDYRYDTRLLDQYGNPENIVNNATIMSTIEKPTVYTCKIK